MAAFRVDRFTGIRPISDVRKLPLGHAEAAINSDLVASDLRPFGTVAAIANVSGVTTPKSAFVFSEDLMFVFDTDVSATYGPIQDDAPADNKVYIASGFKDYPVYSTRRLGALPIDGPYHGAPLNWRKLGVPPGSTKPLVELSALLAGGVEEVTIVAFPDEERMMVVCTAHHGLESGQRVRIDGLNEDWADIAGSVFTITLISTQAFTLNNYNTEPHSDGEGNDLTPSGGGTWLRESNAEDIEDRIYVYTYVTDQGEEGPPSDPSVLVTLAPGQVPTITMPTATDPDDDTVVAFKRIYRTVPTSSGTADFYFVAEVSIGSQEYEDTISFIELGEPLPSVDWNQPPAGLLGLTVLPNGIMAGYVGRTLYMCEPYQPHAWPSKYTKKMDNDIVGLAAFAQSLIVVTEENPYVGTATDPLSMSLSKLDTIEPCIAGRACKTLGYGACYPSPNGLVLVTPGGAENVLQNVWGEKEWRALFTAGEAFAEVHDGRYYLFFENGSAIVFDPTSDSLEISYVTVDSVYGAAVDRDEDRLYLLRDSGGPKVAEWNPDDAETFMSTDWTSQTFVMPYPVNMGAFQVFYRGSGTIEIDFYADDVLKYEATVTNQEPARLPSGFLAREWKIVVRTNVPVQGIYVAETISELRGAMAS